jgi:hypothetical protein
MKCQANLVGLFVGIYFLKRRRNINWKDSLEKLKIFLLTHDNEKTNNYFYYERELMKKKARNNFWNYSFYIPEFIRKCLYSEPN